MTKNQTEFVDSNIVIKNFFLLAPTFPFTQRSPNGGRFRTDRNNTLKGFRKVMVHEREVCKINARTLGPNHTAPVSVNATETEILKCFPNSYSSLFFSILTLKRMCHNIFQYILNKFSICILNRQSASTQYLLQ